MSDSLSKLVKDVCQKYRKDRTRLMDVVRDVQQAAGHVPGAAMDLIAKELATHRVEVESLTSFYAFLTKNAKGRIVIRLCNDVIDEMKGADKVAAAFSSELGIPFGATTKDGKFTLEHTPCIGMCDQAPGAMVNDVIVTNLTPAKAKEIVKTLRKKPDPRELVT
jgi:[NiFe] hydrogenase diaphorase moiety large subunit